MSGRPPAQRQALARFLHRRQEAERLSEEIDPGFGTHIVDALLDDFEITFVEYNEVEGVVSEPDDIAKVARSSEGYVVWTPTKEEVRASGIHEIQVLRSHDGASVSIRGKQIFSLPCRASPDGVALIWSLIKRLRNPEKAPPWVNHDIELSTKYPIILVDGASIARMPRTNWGPGGPRAGVIGPLVAVRRALMVKGYFPLIIYDQSLRQDPAFQVEIFDREIAPCPPHVGAPPNQRADEILITQALDADKDPDRMGLLDRKYIVTTDYYRREIKKFPEFEKFDANARVIEVQWAGKNPSFFVVGHPKHDYRKPRMNLPGPSPLPVAGDAFADPYAAKIRAEGS